MQFQSVVRSIVGNASVEYASAKFSTLEVIATRAERANMVGRARRSAPGSKTAQGMGGATGQRELASASQDGPGKTVLIEPGQRT